MMVLAVLKPYGERFRWLNTLNAFIRSCKSAPSRTTDRGKAFPNAKSTCSKFGPRKEFRPTPSAHVAGAQLFGPGLKNFKPPPAKFSPEIMALLSVRLPAPPKQ